MTSERYDRGAKLLQDKRPDEYKNMTEKLAATAPDIARYTIEFAYGDIWSRAQLELKTKAIVTVTTLAAMGGAEPQLKSHLAGALKCGCTETELIEIFTQMIPYAGFPRALNALNCLKEIMAA